MGYLEESSYVLTRSPNNFHFQSDLERFQKFPLPYIPNALVLLLYISKLALQEFKVGAFFTSIGRLFHNNNSGQLHFLLRCY